MSKCGIGEYDRTRQRNQFTRHERDHLLCIMSEFSEKLEDKNLSILARKEIWTTIDRKFRDGGFTDRTTAQLKKYWQNYKYHNGRNKWKKENAAMEMEFLNKSAKIHSDSSICLSEFTGQTSIDAGDCLQSSDKITHFYDDESETSMDLIEQPAVIISETDISGSSVTVSVIHSKNGKRKNSSDIKNDELNYEMDKGIINNEVKVNLTKKLKGKCLLLQPRKSNKIESSIEFNDNHEKYSSIGKIDQSQSIKNLKSSNIINDNIRNDEQLITNDRQFISLMPHNTFYPEQFNLSIDIDNHREYQVNNFPYHNLHVIRQLQLLHHLEAEEHRLKVKLAEMSLKETHLKILHLKEECESAQMKFTT